ncbi:MAG TPA: hypothetical protein VIG24_18405 [Acidimicrobiia bacterium]
MVTTLNLRDHLGRLLTNATPGTSDATDHLGRDIVANDLDYVGRDLIATARANSTAYAVGDYVEFASGNLYKVTGAGTSAAAEPAETGVGYGDSLTDGTATLERVF